MAFKLEEAKEYDLASSVYINVLKLRPQDSQSFRDLGLMYAETNKPQGSFDLLSSILIDDLDEKIKTCYFGSLPKRLESQNCLQKTFSSNHALRCLIRPAELKFEPVGSF